MFDFAYFGNLLWCKFCAKKKCVHVCTRRVPAHFYFKGFRFILLPKYHYHLYFWEGEGGMIFVCVCVRARACVSLSLSLSLSDMNFAAGIGPNF
jgi:hypothetical protein